MNKVIRIIPELIIFCSLFFGGAINAQGTVQSQSMALITLGECYQWTRENYPLMKQMDIVDKTTLYNLSNASSGNLPQISINGQATYQSDVTEVPIEIPNMEIQTINKDQYKIFGEVYQPLTNYMNVNANKKLITHKGEIEKQKIAVELYKLKDRINQLFFGILLINEKIEQFEIIQSNLDSTLVKVEAGIANGTATLTDKQLLKVEDISLGQQIEENKANKLAFLEMLSTLTGKPITENTQLQKPISHVQSSKINRPELQLYSLQNQTIDLQIKQIENSLLPQVGLFAQGGYGRPALNFLSNDFEFYYIGGVKFKWNISALYNYKNTKKSLNLVHDKISIQQKTFLLNTKLIQSQQSAEIIKYRSLIKSDKEIIQLRQNVLETAKVQLSNGLITTIDYVKILNDVSNASQMLLLHETQLLLAQINLKTTTGDEVN